MRTEYWIKNLGKWEQVDGDEYRAFQGEKEVRPSTWRMMIITSMLLPYRYENSSYGGGIR